MKKLCLAMTAAFATVFLMELAEAAEPETYALCYRFLPGETLCWEVNHRTNVRSSVSGTTQTAETLSISAKQWRVVEVRADGAVTFENSVPWVDMRQKLTGREEVRYDSRTAEKAPVGFEGVARSVGIPLSVVTMDAHGKVLSRKRHDEKSQAATDALGQNESSMTIPLPEEAVPIGHTWSFPMNIDVPLESGGVKRVKAVQKYTLEDVKTGVATIRVATEVLTPINDPAVESQLVQREVAGRVRFDIDAGRILSQQMDIDKRVVGFRGDASSIHYVNRFSEQLLPPDTQTAGKKQEPPK